MTYRELKKSDITQWELLARPEFLETDFCDRDYLLEKWDYLKGFILLNEQDWVGVILLDFNSNVNAGGVSFLQVITFPNYRGKGYTKYLYKLGFDNSKGLFKTGCVDPENIASQNCFINYGFTHKTFYKHWQKYECAGDYYPNELKEVHIYVQRIYPIYLRPYI